MRPAEMVDLASARLGSVAMAANDEFFAPKENLLKPSAPVWNEEYTDRGKWMDGWETRRRREAGFDWCIIRLGIPGIVHGFVVDTSFFRGNYPERCSIEGCTAGPDTDPETLAGGGIVWRQLLRESALKGDAKNEFAAVAAAGGEPVTHLRLNIFPDGGVARLRAFGEPTGDPALRPTAGSEMDLAALEHGAFVLSCSDMFFGDRHNLIMPGRAASMADGWETKRRRGPGHDWAVVRLAARGTITRIEVDTAWFRGNAPGRCTLETLDVRLGRLEDPSPGGAWRPLVGDVPLRPDTRHPIAPDSGAPREATHVRLNIFPDGGVSRLRIWGIPDGR